MVLEFSLEGEQTRKPHIPSPSIFFLKKEKNLSPRVPHISSPFFRAWQTTVTCAQIHERPGSAHPEFSRVLQSFPHDISFTP
jgi:hypothetical protein